MGCKQGNLLLRIETKQAREGLSGQKRLHAVVGIKLRCAHRNESLRRIPPFDKDFALKPSPAKHHVGDRNGSVRLWIPVVLSPIDKDRLVRDEDARNAHVLTRHRNDAHHRSPVESENHRFHLRPQGDKSPDDQSAIDFRAVSRKSKYTAPSVGGVQIFDKLKWSENVFIRREPLYQGIAMFCNPWNIKEDRLIRCESR